VAGMKKRMTHAEPTKVKR